MFELVPMVLVMGISNFALETNKSKIVHFQTTHSNSSSEDSLIVLALWTIGTEATEIVLAQNPPCVPVSAAGTCTQSHNVMEVVCVCV